MLLTPATLSLRHQDLCWPSSRGHRAIPLEHPSHQTEAIAWGTLSPSALVAESQGPGHPLQTMAHSGLYKLFSKCSTLSCAEQGVRWPVLAERSPNPSEGEAPC